MITAVNRPAALHINLAAIKENTRQAKAHLKPGQKLFCVVKANAYGHGAARLAPVMEEAGADGFCVAMLDEGLELRRAQIVKPILVLGLQPAEEAALAAAHDISLPVSSLDWLKKAEKVLRKEGLQLKIHLAIDSGMGRIGFSEDEDFKAVNEYLQGNDAFFVEGMFTHFASADSADASYFDYQVKRFKHMESLLTVKPKWIHVDNTAAILFDKDVASDIVRFGIGLYGLNPSSAPGSRDLEPAFALKPAMSFVSELTYVKQIHKGYGVGYGSTHIAEEDEWIGTVPVGYADGWIRKFQGFKVKVGDTYCPIVGRVCMDQFMVLLPKEVPAGTPVELISADPAAPNSLRRAADWLDTIHYEVACQFNDRLDRIYDNE